MRRLFILLSLFPSLLSCEDSAKDNVWYSTTKKRIEADSDKLIDSASYEKVNEEIVAWTYFAKGKRIKLEFVNERNGMKGLALFDSTQQFELRQEICDKELTFEGITYKGEFYGLSKWWNCDGQLIKRGNRYKSKKIGKWESWDEDNKLAVEQYGNERLLDSLAVIK